MSINKVIEALREDIIQTMKKENIPSLAISIVNKEGTIWSEGFGYTDNKNSRKVDKDTIFSIQSMGKTITATAFLLAVQKGLIHLDDKLLDYYPEFNVHSRFEKNEEKKITFRHLLSHQSGLTHHAPIGGEWDCMSKPTFEDYVKSISDTWLRYPVENRHSYSNLGMSLVAFVLQLINEKSFPDYVKDELCEPLEINSMVYGKQESLKNDNRAEGLVNDRVPEYENIIFYGAGGQFVSVNDLSKFIQFQLSNGSYKGKQILSPELLEEMRTIQYSSEEQLQGHGLGLTIDKETYKGIAKNSHTGSGYGYAAAMMWMVEQDIGVVVLTNKHPNQHANRIATKALELILQSRDIDLLIPENLTPEKFISKPRKEMEIESFRSLEGMYAITGGKVEIVIEEKNLMVIYQGQKFKLYPHSETEFTCDIPVALRIFLNTRKVPIYADILLPEGVVHRLSYVGENKFREAGPNLRKWEKHLSVYRARYLGADWYFCIMIQNGYLTFLSGSEPFNLEEGNEEMFFAEDGRVCFFTDNHLHFDNIKAEKLENPVSYILKLSQEKAEDPSLKKSNLETLEKYLKLLGREEERIELSNIILSMYPNN